MTTQRLRTLMATFAVSAAVFPALASEARSSRLTHMQLEFTALDKASGANRSERIRTNVAFGNGDTASLSSAHSDYRLDISVKDDGSRASLVHFSIYKRDGDGWRLVAEPAALADFGQPMRISLNMLPKLDLRFTLDREETKS